MQEGSYAIYHGKVYSSGRKKNGKLILRSSDAEDIRNGFEECKPFIYSWDKSYIVCWKFVNRNEVEEYYEIRTKAMYQGYDFEVVDEKDEMISIVTMVGDYRVWLSLGMESIDRGVYQKWIGKNEAEIRVLKEAL